MAFTERYGPWAIVAGGAEGTGRSLAHAIAAQGVNCLLIDHAPAVEQTAAEIRRESGVEVATATIDLTHPEAAARVIAAAGEREIGLFVSNAGADWFGRHFADGDIGGWLALSRLNIDTMLHCTYHFGSGMRRRRRGGILIVSSGAAYGGSPHLAVYSAAKAFQINFAESLWAEMGPHGVDVCTIVLGRTDTPAYRRRREKQGIAITNHGLASPDEVAQLALDRLAHGPVVNWGLQDNDPGFMCLSAADRRRRVETLHKLLSEDNDYLFTANG